MKYLIYAQNEIRRAQGQCAVKAICVHVLDIGRFMVSQIDNRILNQQVPQSKAKTNHNYNSNAH